MPDTANEIVVDADGHLCEPADLWERELPAAMRDRGIRLRWNEATGYDECWVEDRMATDRGPSASGTERASTSSVAVATTRASTPAGFDATERLKVLDPKARHRGHVSGSRV